MADNLTPITSDQLPKVTTAKDTDLVTLGINGDFVVMTLANLKEVLGINALNTNIGNVSIITREITTDDNGDAYFQLDGYSVLLNAETNTNSAKVSWFRNQYDMTYINIKKSDGSAYTGKFTIWALVAK